MATRDELKRAIVAAHRAGDEDSARRIAGMLAAAPEDAPATGVAPPSAAPVDGVQSLPRATARIFKGAGDAALSMARGLVNGPATAIAGLTGTAGVPGALEVGAPGTWQERYNAAKAAGRAEIEKGNTIVGSERLRTPEGEQTAAALSDAMRYTGVPQVTDALKDTGNKTIGPELTDMAGNALSLLMLKGGAPAKATSALRTPADLAVSNMRKAGFIVPPATVLETGAKARYAGTLPERTAAGMASQSTIEDAISVANEKVVNKWAAKAAGLKDGTPLTPQAVDALTKQANDVYEAVKAYDVPVLIPLEENQALMDRINNLGESVSKFKDKVGPEILELRRSLLKVSGAKVKDFVDKVRELRDDSFKNSRAADNAGGAEKARLAKAQRQAADILDDALDVFFRNEQKSATNPAEKKLLGQYYQSYIAARKQLSTLHVLRDSMNDVNGFINAKKIADSADEITVDPNLQVIADAYKTNSKAFKPVEGAARTAASKISRVDSISLGFGLTGALTAGKAYGPLAGAGAFVLATGPMLTRLAAARYALRSNATRVAQQRGITAARAAKTAVAKGGGRLAVGNSLLEQVQGDER